MVVVDQIGIPLVGLGAKESVPALEAAAGRPVAARRGQIHLVGGAEVPLADHVGVPAQLAEDLGEHAVLRWNRATGVGETDRGFGDAGHAVARVVASGQQARTRGRTERRRVPLRVAHAVGGDAVDVGRRDGAAVAGHRREADVVEHDIDDVGRPVRRLRRLEGRPVGRRIADVHVDDAREGFTHIASLLALWRAVRAGQQGLHVAAPGHLRVNGDVTEAAALRRQRPYGSRPGPRPPCTPRRSPMARGPRAAVRTCGAWARRRGGRTP